jgi:lipopolysaccharide transport system ATP-binding protein
MSQQNSPDPIISLRNVGVSYSLKRGYFKRSRHQALKNISFDIFNGDSLGIVGKNGSGKSTLLRLLAGVMSPDDGSIINKGVRVSLLSISLGFVGHLSGVEDAILSGMFMGMPKNEIKSKIPAIIEYSELGDFIYEPVGAYSTGMRARLGFAVALQVEPDVLLLDEVTSVGDAAFREKSFGEIQKRLLNHDSTVVFVSHNATEVKRLCTKAIWIEKGEIQAQGETSDVTEKYKQFLKI